MRVHRPSHRPRCYSGGRCDGRWDIVRGRLISHRPRCHNGRRCDGRCIVRPIVDGLICNRPLKVMR